MALKKDFLKAIIFDLDDTLFDTFGQLVAPANREACQAMIENGLNGTLDQCLKLKEELSRSQTRQNVFEAVAKKLGVSGPKSTEEVAQAGFHAFHERKVDETITLFDDCLTTINRLKRLYKIYLVTLGSPQTQKRKVEKLGLDEAISEIIYVDINKTHEKTKAFSEIQKSAGLKSSEIVVIGNRRDLEISNGKKLGMQTILMDHGEYVHMKPQNDMEVPDATVKKLGTLVELLT